MRIALKVNNGGKTETVCAITEKPDGVVVFADGRQERLPQSLAVDILIGKFAEVIANFIHGEE